MVSSLRALFNGSWLMDWDGLQKSYIKTTNRHFKKMYDRGVDSPLTIVLVKLAIQYAYPQFIKALEIGISFDYQTYNYVLIKGRGGYVNLIVTHLENETTPLNHSITYSLHNNMAKNNLNDDIDDIVKVLLSKGL